MKSYAIISFLFLFSGVIADVSISKPTTGQLFKVSGGSVSVQISWIESQSTPLLSEIESYSFTICTGPNSDINGIKTLEKISADNVPDNTYNLEIPASIGSDGNYFVQVYALTKEGGYSIHYTNRFMLEGMTGVIIPSGDNLTPPNAEINVDGGEQVTLLSNEELSRSYALYYTSQTGKTRYAPMQTQPGSKVTATAWTRRYPTSAVTSYFKAINHELEQLSTLTPSWSYTINSDINYASPAPYPSANGGWYHPSQRIRPATISSISIPDSTASSRV